MNRLSRQPKICTVIHRNTKLNKPAQTRDMPIKMNVKHSAIIIAYNAFIANLTCDKNWIENRAHKENQLMTCGSDYQLSASRYFLFKGVPYTFTVELKLTDKTLKPKMVTLTLGQRSGGESSKSFNANLLTTMMSSSPQAMTDFVNARVDKTLKKFKGQKIEPLQLKTFEFDLELIEQNYLSEYWGNLSDLKVIAFDGFSNDTKVYVQFKSDGLPYTQAFYLYEYFVDVDMKKAFSKKNENVKQALPA